MPIVDIFQALHDQIATNVALLPDKPEETAETTLRALWLAAAGSPMSAVMAAQQSLPPLTEAQHQTLQNFVTQRQAGKPLAHITNRTSFMGMELLTDVTALVPRRETEILVHGILAANQELTHKPAVIIDVCTGSGNVALALAQALPAAVVYGADLSVEAVALARRNAQHLGMEQRVEFRSGDLCAPFETPDFLGHVDILTCNPPYISSAKVTAMPAEISEHEPRLAFDGGPFGIAILMRFINDAPRFLRPGGWFGFEVGLGQGPGMIKRVMKSGQFHDLKALNDTQGEIRAIIGQFAPH